MMFDECPFCLQWVFESSTNREGISPSESPERTLERHVCLKPCRKVGTKKLTESN